MKCENCKMGFVVAEYNVQKKCPHCGHIHESLISEKEDNMIQKLIKKIWKILSWPFRAALNWLKGCLPNK